VRDETDYDEGYDNGREDGKADALTDLAKNPAEIFDHLLAYQFRSFFDALKLEAIRLGVKP
jgi:hypothetical protein